MARSLASLPLGHSTTITTQPLTYWRMPLFAAPGEEASPSPLEVHALGAIEARLAVGDTLANSREYGRLLQSYERMFWNTLADAQ